MTKHLAAHTDAGAGITDGDYLSTIEAARLADTSSENIRRLARTGRLPVAISTRAGRLFRRADVLAIRRERSA